MRIPRPWESCLAGALLIAAGVLALRLVDAIPATRTAIGGRDPAALAPDTRAFLERLEVQVLLTYFVSPSGAMPATHKRLEREVRAVLEAFQAAAPERVRVRVIDPTLDPQHGPAFAASKRAAPVALRTVEGDAAAQAPIWSSLVISREGAPDAHVHGIAPADAPYLEPLIITNLIASTRPLAPIVAVAGSTAGHGELPARIQHVRPGAQVVHVDFDAVPTIPPQTDLLFWIEPRRITPAHRAEIERFLRAGGNAVVAGSTHAIEPLPPAPDTAAGRYRTRPTGVEWQHLLEPLGLELMPLLLLDRLQDRVPWQRPDGSVVQVNAPFNLRIPAMHWNMKPLLGPPSGALLLAGANPIGINGTRLAATGRTAIEIVTTSPSARVLELSGSADDGELGVFTDAMMESALPVPKQPVLALLSARDPWQGQFLLVSSASLFRDVISRQGGNANDAFLRTLLRTFTEPARLARARVERATPALLPPLGDTARIGWRAFVVGLVPMLAIIVALRVTRRARAPGVDRRAMTRSSSTSLSPSPSPSPTPRYEQRRGRRLARAAGMVLALLALGAGLRVLALPGPRAAQLDLTRDAQNTPSPTTRAQLAQLAQHGADLRAECFFSAPAHVPATEKSVEREVLATLRALGVPAQVIRPEDLAPAARAALHESGIAPFAIERVEGDATVHAPIYAGVRLMSGEATTAIPRLDTRSVRHLEFLLAAAARRLATGGAPRIALLSDLPRLTPAEAHADFQQKGYTAPIGTDVYSAAKTLLGAYGYEVLYLHPDEPVLPPDLDALLWLQPRYPWRFLPQFVEHLARGGKALVALQHYNVQQRQFMGRGMETVYWPQPQFHGFNDYLRFLGLRQMGDKVGDVAGEVLFDRSRGLLRLETQVNRSAFREYDSQEVGRPFLIRTVAGSLSPSSVITARLGELMFIWGSRFTLDLEAIDALGLHHEVLVTTSPETWTYAWSGGFLTESAFVPPEDGSVLGRLPLALRLWGPFPRPSVRPSETGRVALGDPEAPTDPSVRSELILIGCSEMFKNEHLHAPGQDHDQLLLNAVAALAHGPELAAIQAHRRATPRFAPPTDEERTAWRLTVVALPTAMLLAYGALYRLLRRRPVMITHPAGSTRHGASEVAA